MAIVSDLVNKAKDLFGVDVSEVHLDPEQWIDAVNWAGKVMAQHMRMFVKEETVNVPSTREVPLPDGGLGIVMVMGGNPMKVLLKTNFQAMVLRRPDWETTAKEPQSWAYLSSNVIAVDGAAGGVLVHYLEAPALITGNDESTDARFASVNEMAFAYLMAAYCLQIAGDAASLQRAQAYFTQGMSLAGVKQRVEMPTGPVSGGERANA